MTRLYPALFALLGSTFAASAALAGQDAPSTPAAAVSAPAIAGELSCKAIREQLAALPAETPSRGRQLFGFGAALLQAAGPSFGGYGGSTAGAVAGAIVQQGAAQAMQSAATAPVADQRKRLGALAEAKGC